MRRMLLAVGLTLGLTGLLASPASAIKVAGTKCEIYRAGPDDWPAPEGTLVLECEARGEVFGLIVYCQEIKDRICDLVEPD